MEQRRRAEAREKVEMRDNAPHPARALARGLGLIAFAGAVPRPAETRQDLSHEDLLADERWARLRTALREP